MPTEQDKLIAALKYAIKMETEGKAYYLSACAGSSNELGKKLLESLAKQEDNHRQKFEQLYEKIRQSHAWPKVDFKTDGGKTLRTIFVKETEGGKTCAPGNDTELEIIQKAMHMEGDSYDFYHGRSEQSATDGEKEFFSAVAAEEREHQLVLTDYYEYLKDPAGWFTMTERHSLDGG